MTQATASPSGSASQHHSAGRTSVARNARMRDGVEGRRATQPHCASYATSRSYSLAMVSRSPAVPARPGHRQRLTRLVEVQAGQPPIQQGTER
ncbi:hypothetical protein ACQEVF_11155 [Nonomuraea polychroma]|uniref:hypothetical protein n=1 Tax=Nonomuraea polychroma TaxID=46176 RepID=UPI003D91A591